MADSRPYSIGWDDGFDDELEELAGDTPARAMDIDTPPTEAAPALASQPAVSSPAPCPPGASEASRASQPSSAYRPPEPQLPPFPRAQLLDYFPAFFARSGLFAADRVMRKEGARQTQILGQGRMRAMMTGERLSMADKLVFEALVVLAKRAGLSLHEPLRCSERAIAREMGWGDSGGGNSRFIWSSLRRLASARVSFDLGDGVPRAGAPLKSIAKRGGNGVDVCFDPAFTLPVFGVAKQYKIDRKRREKLKSPLAKWLHDFVSTHSKPHPIDLRYLRERSGFEGAPKRFVEQLRRAAEEIMTKAPELLAAYAIENFTRSSSGWKVTFHRGGEAAGFVD